MTIRLAACGVCHSDLSATNGTISYPLPNEAPQAFADLAAGRQGRGVIIFST